MQLLISLTGIVAAILTTLCQVPQLIKIFKTKHTKDLSLPTYTALGIGVFLWMIYGLFINDLIIIIANVVTFIIVAWIWLLKKNYG